MAKFSERLVKAELARRDAPSPFDPRSYLFEQQLNFKHDSSRFKVAMCSRRSGKTVACAADLIDTATSNDGVVCLYITLSRKNAARIVWPELKRINREHKLGGRFNNTELSVTFPNGSTIYCSGAKDVSEIEKFRGLAIKLVYIDEAQSFRTYLEALIDDVLAPALMDYAGTLNLIGTPPPLQTGYFYKAYNSQNTWGKHGWTFFDNPHIASKSGKTHLELLNAELERRGVTVDDPSIQREFFGKCIMDLDSLLLKYDPAKNHYDELPPGNYEHILGIDLGFDDADALAVVGWNQTSKHMYLIEEVVVAGQEITPLVDKIQELDRKYNFVKMVIDEGGLGKKIAEEIRRRKHIPVHAAEKQRKMENVAFLNDYLRRGDFKAKKDSIFAQDSYLLEKDMEKSTPDKIKVRDNFHSDIIDAVLYAFKASPAYSYTAPPQKPKPGTEAWYKEYTEQLQEAAMEYFTALEQNNKDPYDGYE